MNISATERAEVKQDMLTATLRFQFDGADATSVQNEINETMAKAVKKAKGEKTLQVQTLRYNIYQYDINQGKKGLARRMAWRGDQSLQIKSTDNDTVLKVAGELQKMGLLMNGLGFSVSTKLRDDTQSDLLEKALARLVTKAKRAGKALGKGNVDLLKVDVGQNSRNYNPQPVMMRSVAMADSAKMAAPVAEAGQSEISLNVNAVALLKR